MKNKIIIYNLKKKPTISVSIKEFPEIAHQVAVFVYKHSQHLYHINITVPYKYGSVGFRSKRGEF